MPISVIKPSDIDTSQHFGDAFGNHETEVSANYIVRFCQSRNSWEPFTYGELNSFCKGHGYRGNFWFGRLIQDGFIRQEYELNYVVPRFICRCYEASPVREQKDDI